MEVFSGNAFFEKVLYEAFNKPITVKSSTHQSGGCINNALKLHTSEGDFFIKWQTDIPGDMFEKEAKGLELLAQTKCIRIPKVIRFGYTEGKHYLLTEYVQPTSRQKDYWTDYGCSLAKMHLSHTAEIYGLDHNNYIGRLHQQNEPIGDWITFFIEKRLEVQLRLAIQNRLVSNDFIDRYRKFYQMLPDLLPSDRPALLHGDMWSGNVMVGSDGKVCLIDPAVYYGHREIELAFTQMFGGFPDSFYHAYEEAGPLIPGFRSRIEIYNIYPNMVHLNLFGLSYLSGTEHVLRKYL